MFLQEKGNAICGQRKYLDLQIVVGLFHYDPDHPRNKVGDLFHNDKNFRFYSSK